MGIPSTSPITYFMRASLRPRLLAHRMEDDRKLRANMMARALGHHLAVVVAT